MPWSSENFLSWGWIGVLILHATLFSDFHPPMICLTLSKIILNFSSRIACQKVSQSTNLFWDQNVWIKQMLTLLVADTIGLIKTFGPSTVSIFSVGILRHVYMVPTQFQPFLQAIMACLLAIYHHWLSWNFDRLQPPCTHYWHFDSLQSNDIPG